MLDKIYKVADDLGAFLIGYDTLAIPAIINANTINVDNGLLPYNNTIYTFPASFGKSTLMKILAHSNPKDFIMLPGKVFESHIMKWPKENFHRKVWMMDDMIVSFQGMSKKQKEQLVGFFVDFLANQKYERSDNSGSKVSVSGKISCIFGFAYENFKKNKEELMTATFLDRFAVFYRKFHHQEIDHILDKYVDIAKNIDKKQKYPKVKIKILKTPVKIHVPDKFNDLVKKEALDFSKHKFLGPTRAVNYIINFIRSCAQFNERLEVCQADWELFQESKRLMFNLELGITSGLSPSESVIRDFIKGKTDDWISSGMIQSIIKEQFHPGTIKRSLASLTRQGILEMRQIKNSNGGLFNEYKVNH